MEPVTRVGGGPVDGVSETAIEDYVFQVNVQVAKGQAIDLSVLVQLYALLRVLVVGTGSEVKPGEPMTRWESHRVAGKFPSLESASPTVSPAAAPTV